MLLLRVASDMMAVAAARYARRGERLRCYFVDATYDVDGDDEER